ncbi:MAG: DUF3822 family protein [Sphingobacteriaceae bacterium]|nr:MAG: DUF3822 family protein [Sphingobacteriaceae bacterium]
MNQQTHTYRDSTLNLAQADNYTLLLQIDNNSFAYAIADGNLLLACETNCSLSELTDPKQLYERLTADYKSTVISLPAKAFVLIPDSLFTKDNVAEYARLLDVKFGEKVVAQALDTQNQVVYKVDEQLYNTATKYGIKNIVFAPKGWMYAIDRSEPSATDLFLNINSNQVEYAYYKNNRLRFYNKFEFNSVEDLIYYTIFVSDELELSQQSTALIVSGNITEEYELYKRLSEYFAVVMINDIRVLDLPANIPSSQILSLSALSLCAS